MRQASLVVPARHMLPRALDDDTILDEIRIKHKVWITRTKPAIFDLCSDNMRALQDAVKAINWMLHDIRLSGGDTHARFLAQMPASDTPATIVQVRLNERPVVRWPADARVNALAAARHHVEQLCSAFVPSMEAVRDLPRELKMRVNFGLVKVRSRAKGLGSDMSYATFAEMLEQDSSRRSCVFEPQLPNAAVAERLLYELVDPLSRVFYSDGQQLRKRCTLTLRLQGQELVAGAEMLGDSSTNLHSAALVTPDAWPRLNWVTAAPEMQVKPKRRMLP